ncbi:MAG: N-acetylmuramoyl-L-alanine amidase [Candidatus Dormibacteraeota bacterium]|nr:N-acetylmuramoyl-L-alanine amidase [Candidatus Dormibacteraeota bacterium]
MITNLAQVLRNAGLTVVEIDGWRTRRRPGAFNPVGVMWHHTGSSANGRAYAAGILVTGRSDLPGPLCQLSIDRQGVVYVIAAGRANHAGSARANGSVASGDGNTLYIGIEFQISGTEPWTQVQRQAGIRVTVAILRNVTRTSERTVAGHFETSTTGKWDPGDPNGVQFRDKRVLDMSRVRADVAATLKGSGANVAQKPTRISNARRDLQAALNKLNAAIANGRNARRITISRDAIRDTLNRLPQR